LEQHEYYNAGKMKLVFIMKEKASIIISYSS